MCIDGWSWRIIIWIGRGAPAATEKNQSPPQLAKWSWEAGAAKGRCVPVLARAGLDLLSLAVNGLILPGAIGCHMDWTRVQPLDLPLH